jgi:hypothetical protein
MGIIFDGLEENYQFKIPCKKASDFSKVHSFAKEKFFPKAFASGLSFALRRQRYYYNSMAKSPCQKPLPFLTLFLLGVLCLSGCGKSLSRADAFAMLDTFHSMVTASDYDKPNEWSHQLSEKGSIAIPGESDPYNGIRSTSVSFRNTPSKDDCYYHYLTTVSAVNENKSYLSLDYSQEKWIYLSKAADGTPVVISASSDGMKSNSSGVSPFLSYSLSEFASKDKAKKAWSEDSSIQEEIAVFSQIQEAPENVKKEIVDLEAKAGAFTSETYNSSDSSDLDVVVCFNTDRAYTLKATFEDFLLKSYLYSSEDGVSSLSKTYSWGGIKETTPNLVNYSLEHGGSSL